jgi:hypothetical protein
LTPGDAVGAIWKEAIDRYKEIMKVKIGSLTRASNVDEVLSETRKRETIFQGYRHDETKLDKFRALVSKSLSPIEKVGSMVASAASVVRGNPVGPSISLANFDIAAVLSAQLWWARRGLRPKWTFLFRETTKIQLLLYPTS